MSGVPRTTQITAFIKPLRGLKRLMEPNDIISPRGIAPIRVIEKSLSVCKKPVFNAANTVGNCFIKVSRKGNHSYSVAKIHILP